MTVSAVRPMPIPILDAQRAEALLKAQAERARAGVSEEPRPIQDTYEAAGIAQEAILMPQQPSALDQPIQYLLRNREALIQEQSEEQYEQTLQSMRDLKRSFYEMDSRSTPDTRQEFRAQIQQQTNTRFNPFDSNEDMLLAILIKIISDAEDNFKNRLLAMKDSSTGPGRILREQAPRAAEGLGKLAGGFFAGEAGAAIGGEVGRAAGEGVVGNDETRKIDLMLLQRAGEAVTEACKTSSNVSSSDHQARMSVAQNLKG